MAILQRPPNINDEQQWLQLTTLLEQLGPDQKLWLSGFLAASAHAAPANSPSVNKTVNQVSTTKLTILYGSQTGNGESVARQLKTQSEAIGLQVELFSLEDISVKQLAKKTHVSLIISTHGEGEAPDDAEVFYEQLFSHKAPDLSALKYSILALGDTSYELFCQTGKEIDQRLTALGAKQLLERVDCDVDFEATAAQWVSELLPKIEIEFKHDNQDINNIRTLPLSGKTDSHDNSMASKQNPYLAEILTMQKITGRDSGKNTFHLELGIDPEHINYHPGDSLGIWAHNNEKNVQQLLHHWQLKGDETHTFKGQSKSIKSLLTEHIEITQISKPFVQFLASRIDHQELKLLAESHPMYTAYCKHHQLTDLISTFDPTRSVSIEDALQNLKNITPRLYSIASSQQVTDDEVHLTINLEDASEAGHFGLASGLLCHTAEVGEAVSVYVEPNENFRLPEHSDTPVIMIGPGTGIAPFRAFLQQRQDQQATGNNWLFFGNPHFSSDFLYQTEWLKLQKSGLLTQLDVAFSRDQAQKVYVQDKLKAKANLVWEWLQDGAHLYLCGDANRMAKDVEATLLDIIREQGAMSDQDARNHLKALKRQNRYQKDVY